MTDSVSASSDDEHDIERYKELEQNCFVKEN